MIKLCLNLKKIRTEPQFEENKNGEKGFIGLWCKVLRGAQDLSKVAIEKNQWVLISKKLSTLEYTSYKLLNIQYNNSTNKLYNKLKKTSFTKIGDKSYYTGFIDCQDVDQTRISRCKTGFNDEFKYE
jgi:hypothetical protein